MAEPTTRRGRLSPFGWLTRRSPAPLDHRDAVVAELYPEGPELASMLNRFVVLAVLSSIIASLGLALDSAAAVIGAMLLGPFMAPLLGAALAVIDGRPRRFVRSLGVTALGVAASFLTAWVIGLVIAEPVSLGGLSAQLVALTRPSLLDLGIALAAGVAAGYATVRPSASGALPGVAVSVTLEPPLAAMGILLAVGQRSPAEQAALNFVTNLGAIVLGAAVTMVALGFVQRTSAADARRSHVGLALGALTMVVIAVPLTLHSIEVVEDERLAEQVARAVRRWDPSVVVTELEVSAQDGGALVAIDASGPAEPEPVWRLAELLSQERGERVELDLRFTRVEERRAVATG